MADITTVKDIETAINRLTLQEYEELMSWIDTHTRPEPIDLQLKADLQAGRLDELIDRAVEDYNSGRIQPL